MTRREFAEAGAHLVLTDIDAQGLSQAQRDLSAYGGDVVARVVDVTQRDQGSARQSTP